MNPQIIITPGGERLVLVPEADFEALVAAAEDNADRTAVAEFRRKLAAGEEELVPASVVERLVSGENRVRVWREHRGLSGAALAKQAGLAQAYLSQIETGAREGTVETYGKLAAALSVSLDDLAG
ncbi:helix-turn-helix domain-containing protein [Methylorubrum extorquens]|jgi:DNA-binding XRE family transcriptional regulator|uniref:helix-turn-helix domain-containing protein n=1 Tax=Methylorubrum extorquens TaxID=408 RepID=UPI0015FCBFB4|nr:helix-turn-helix transcriptional regulator [Methylorubrum extorquens]MBA9068889.1 DNA-binding XRE family transcriptional regulator [Methylobacterium sp. RAS18]MCP1538667.1 DNA-binding XRE family transcriptional regulator [Methylorubrum extorquens]UYW25487.1 helix-turn-helix transcriptional regulator [Methylorubrum extorquens]UYW34654.1 helix-turn-helix transcriptional regulator [Methylorubrum extorquens]